MGSFCIDEDMAPAIADGLATRGHDAFSVKRHALRGSGDEAVLVRATEEGRITVTHNERHFKLLHRAWLAWPLSIPHGGILIIPQRYRLPAEVIAEQLDVFALRTPSASNRLFLLQQRPPGSMSYAWEE